MADFPHKPWAQPEHRNRQFKPEEHAPKPAETAKPVHEEEGVISRAFHVVKDMLES